MPTYTEQHHRIRYKFLPCNGFIEAGTRRKYDSYYVVEGGADADQPIVFFMMQVPDDFVSFTSVEAKWFSTAAAGNMYWQLEACYGACGGSYRAFTDTPALGVTATGGNNVLNCQEPANPLTLADLALGDVLGIEFNRNGAHGNDTIDALVELEGLLFTYVGHK